MLCLELAGLFLRLPELRVGAAVFKHCKHSGHQVIDQVAMKRPYSGIIRIKRDRDLRTGRNQNGIAQSTGQLLTVDFHDLEIMSMQMHWMTMLVAFVKTIPTRSPFRTSRESRFG
jgi:hypothetical protein